MTASADAVARVPNWDLRVGRGASRSRAVRRRYFPTAQVRTPAEKVVSVVISTWLA